MPHKEEIENILQAKSNILRGNDIESAALILEKFILDGFMEYGSRVNTLKIATRQILNFIEENKNRENLDYIKENIKLKKEMECLKIENTMLQNTKETCYITNTSGIICHLKENCKRNKCEKCEIEEMCLKYFTREPRNWKIK